MKQSRALPIGLGIFATAAGISAIGTLRQHRLSQDPTDAYTKHGFTRHNMLTTAGRMTYYEAGSGQPLLFLHGIGGGASSWLWSKVATAFSDQYRVIVPDLVGWGLSEHPTRFMLFDDYVAEIEAMLNYIGQPVTVIAQGLMDGAAAHVSTRLPKLVKKLILCSPAGGTDLGEDQFEPFFRFVFEPIARTYPINMIFYRTIFHTYGFIKSWFTRQGFYNRDAVTDDIIDGSLYSARQPNAAYAALPFLSGDLRFDAAPYLRAITIPAIVMWGEHETQIARRVQKGLNAANPNIPVIHVNKAKTNFELEQPAQTIMLIREFLGDPTDTAYPL